MKKIILMSFVSALLCGTGCISLFSRVEINHEHSENHGGGAPHVEELEHRVNELEERVNHLTELLEDRRRERNRDREKE